MTIDIDAAWTQEQDDVINVVADIEDPSARIQYAFQAGCLAGRETIAQVVDERESARRERDTWQERYDLANQTIGEAADLLLADIVEDDVAIDALVLEAIERVVMERDQLQARLRELTGICEP